MRREYVREKPFSRKPQTKKCSVDVWEKSHSTGSQKQKMHCGCVGKKPFNRKPQTKNVLWMCGRKAIQPEAINKKFAVDVWEKSHSIRSQKQKKCAVDVWEKSHSTGSQKQKMRCGFLGEKPFNRKSETKKCAVDVWEKSYSTGSQKQKMCCGCVGETLSNF